MEIRVASRKPANALKVELLFNLMDLAITYCKSATLSRQAGLPAKALANAKKLYCDALRLSSKVSFNARQVAEFEWRSVRIESLIRRLQSQQSATNETPL